jgi:hypothetical protein
MNQIDLDNVTFLPARILQTVVIQTVTLARNEQGPGFYLQHQKIKKLNEKKKKDAKLVKEECLHDGQLHKKILILGFLIKLGIRRH